MTEPRAKKSHIWQRDPLDFYVETEAAVESLFGAVYLPLGCLVWDPACGIGTIPTVATKLGYPARASDIVDRGFPGADQIDFLSEDVRRQRYDDRVAIVCNPPFSKAAQFIEQALAIADHHVAMLLPIKFLASQRRRKLFAETPVSQVLILSKRPSMPPGAVLAAGGKRGGGKEDFCWIVWHRAHVGPPQIGWLA